jgi:phosphoglycolate phosphatase
MTIRGILFDKDGTLIAANGTWVPVYKKLLTDTFKAKADRVEELLEMAGFDRATQGFKAGSILAGGTIEQLVDIWWPDLSALAKRDHIAMINRDYADAARLYLEPLMDLVPIFDELHAMGMMLGVGTNDIVSSATNHMQQLGVHDYFVEVIGADSVAVPKPSGQMIARFAQVTGLAPQEIAMVGDNSHDMEEARAGGAGLALAVLTGNAAHDDIAHLADYTLASVADIPELLRRLGSINTTFE